MYRSVIEYIQENDNVNVLVITYTYDDRICLMDKMENKCRHILQYGMIKYVSKQTIILNNGSMLQVGLYNIENIRFISYGSTFNLVLFDTRIDKNDPKNVIIKEMLLPCMKIAEEELSTDDFFQYIQI